MSDARETPGFGIRDSGFGGTLSSRPDPVELDAVIDTVAREMTGAEPSGALRARVLDEIDRRPGRPGIALPRWAWTGAAAAVVLAVASSMWMATRPADQRPEAAQVAESRPAARDTGSVTRESTEPVAAVPAAGPISASRNTSRGTANAPAERGDEGLPHLPALAAIEPIRFAAVEPAALQVQHVEIVPLTEMPSIDIPSLDRGSNDAQSADPKKEN